MWSVIPPPCLSPRYSQKECTNRSHWRDGSLRGMSRPHRTMDMDCLQNKHHDSRGDVNGAAGGGYDRFATLSGPHKTLAPGQLQWLSQQTKSLAWKLSATLGELHQSDRAKEVLRPTFGMVLPPVEDVEVAPASLSNEESTGGGEGGVEATDDANNAADGADEGPGGGVGGVGLGLGDTIAMTQKTTQLKGMTVAVGRDRTRA